MPNASSSLNRDLVNLAVLGLENAINAALRLDPALGQALEDYRDRAIGLYCSDPELEIVIVLGPHCTVLQNPKGPAEAEPYPVQASLQGDSQAWLQFIKAPDKAAALINSDLQLHGDSQLFQRLAELAATLSIDWESHAAALIGDIPTHIGAEALRRSGSWLRTQQQRLGDELQRYFDSPDSPLIGEQEAENLYSELRELEMHIERLEVRLERL